ncbi:hypothetical protein ACFPRL_07385 [Pseudoclavibacter helvolus]
MGPRRNSAGRQAHCSGRPGHRRSRRGCARQPRDSARRESPHGRVDACDRRAERAHERGGVCSPEPRLPALGRRRPHPHCRSLAPPRNPAGQRAPAIQLGTLSAADAH